MEAERSEILSSKSETKSNAPNFRVCLPRFEFRIFPAGAGASLALRRQGFFPYRV